MSRIRLSDIVFDAGTQIRAAINEATVAEYAELMTAGTQFPPVVLFHDGNHYYMADGFHRGLAAQRNQLRDIDADVRPGTKQDALWFALGANRTNGQRLTAADRKHAVLVALKTWGDGGKTQSEIAAQIGMAESTLSYYAVQLSNLGQLTRPDRVMGKDGKNYPASRSKQKVAAPAAPVGQVRTKQDREERLERARQMAAEGYTTHQMADAFGITVEGLRARLKEHGIDVPADRVVGKTKRHDANRIVSQMVIDAENLTADVNLIEFSALDRAQIAEWLVSLKASRDKLGAFIRRLMQEQQHGEAA